MCRCVLQVYDLRMMRQTPPLSFAPAMNAPTLLGADTKTLPLLAHNLIHRTASLVPLSPCRIETRQSPSRASLKFLALISFSMMCAGSLKERLLVGSSTGQFLLCDPFQLQQSDTEFHQVRQPGMPETRFIY